MQIRLTSKHGHKLCVDAAQIFTTATPALEALTASAVRYALSTLSRPATVMQVKHCMLEVGR